MAGFTGFPGAPSGKVQFQVFKTSGNWVCPKDAQFFIVDVFGAGGSGSCGNSAGSNFQSCGGGGGARQRAYFTAQALKPGTTVPVVVGAGGVSVVAVGSYIGGNAGGKSSFGSVKLGLFVEAYGGGGGTSNGAGGGGIFSAGNSYSSGMGGNPTIQGGSVAGINPNASSDHGGAHGISSGSTMPGNAMWGGGGAGVQNGGGGSVFAAGGGGAYQQNAGASGEYANFGSYSTPANNGIFHALQGAGGWGGRGGSSPGANAVDGGFPGGGGGGVDGTAGAITGKGGDGLVVIYWW